LYAVPDAEPDQQNNPPAYGVAVGLVTLLAAFGAVVLSGRGGAASMRRLQRHTQTKEGGGHGGRV
jgi:hypothetical protein